MEALTGVGLATSAGLNAYVPLLAIGILGRFTDLIELPTAWQWLSNGWSLAILAGLLAIELVADKIPAVDHLNDVVQTAVRPAAGGLAFGAVTSQGQPATDQPAVIVSDPGQFASNGQWVPLVAGIVIALVVHAVKALARPIVNAGTAGFGAPVVSTAEDFTSVLMALVAIVFPVLVLALLGVCCWAGYRIVSRGRRRRAARRSALPERRATAGR